MTRSGAKRRAALGRVFARVLWGTAVAWLVLIFWRVPVYLSQGKYWVLDRLVAIEASVWAAVLGVPLLLE